MRHARRHRGATRIVVGTAGEAGIFFDRVHDVGDGNVFGGLREAKRVHDVCRERGIPVWCGGMHEFGVGRSANLAISALPGFTLPGDISGSDKYYREDLVEPPLLAADGAASGNVTGAVFQYTHDPIYVEAVLAKAAAFERAAGSNGDAGTAANPGPPGDRSAAVAVVPMWSLAGGLPAHAVTDHKNAVARIVSEVVFVVRAHAPDVGFAGNFHRKRHIWVSCLKR